MPRRYPAKIQRKALGLDMPCQAIYVWLWQDRVDSGLRFQSMEEADAP